MPSTQKTLETQIDENLRRIFEEDAETEMPERLLDLLRQLDEVDLPERPRPDGIGRKSGNGAG